MSLVIPILPGFGGCNERTPYFIHELWLHFENASFKDERGPIGLSRADQREKSMAKYRI